MRSKFGDLLVAEGRPDKNEARHVNAPIELGSTMVFNTLSAFEEARDARYESGTLYYGRYGNSASFQLEEAIAKLEGAAGVTLTSSGVSAISHTLSALALPGSHLLVADNVYGNTRNFCEAVLKTRGVEIEYFNPMDIAQFEALIRSETCAVMFETPGTGTFEFPDVKQIAEIAKKKNIVTVLDSTWGSPILLNAISLGVDVVVYSASKHISGHSDCMMGVIASGKADMHKRIRSCVFAYGDKIGGQEVFLALRGLRTIEMRMRHVDQSTREICEWLSKRDEVKKVLHPIFDDCQGHENWKRDFDGAAGLFGVVFHPCSDENIEAFVNALHHFAIGVSWGGYESLVLPVKPMRSVEGSRSEDGQLVRFSIGFENVETLIDDLAFALPLLERNWS